MLRKRNVVAALIFLVAAVAYGAAAQAPMKGYELYSWRRDGAWNFALMPGTNRTKTYQEITSGQHVHRGMEAIRTELRKLPKGATVVWLTDAHPSVDKSSMKDSVRIEHPSGKRIRKLKRYCDELGLKLELG